MAKQLSEILNKTIFLRSFIGCYVKVCSVFVLFVTTYCRMRLLYIICYFWNNNFYRLVQDTDIASFAYGSFHLIDTWLFFSHRRS